MGSFPTLEAPTTHKTFLATCKKSYIPFNLAPTKHSLIAKVEVSVMSCSTWSALESWHSVSNIHHICLIFHKSIFFLSIKPWHYHLDKFFLFPYVFFKIHIYLGRYRLLSIKAHLPNIFSNLNDTQQIVKYLLYICVFLEKLLYGSIVDILLFPC